MSHAEQQPRLHAYLLFCLDLDALLDEWAIPPMTNEWKPQ